MSMYHGNHAMHVTYVKLSVKNRDRSLDFYQRIIGLDLIEDHDSYVIMGIGGKALVYLYFDPSLKQPIPSLGLYHFALLVPNKDALTQAIYRLIKHRYQLSGVADHGVSYAVYLNDPDGHGIEIYADLPTESWPHINGNLTMYTESLDVDGLFQAYPNKNEEKMQNDTIMGHLHLHVDNLDKARRFYNDVLGFQTVLNYGGHALFISDKGYHHHMGLNTWQRGASVPDDGYPRLIGYGLNVPKDMFEKILEKADPRLIHTINQTLEDPYRQIIEIHTK